MNDTNLLHTFNTKNGLSAILLKSFAVIGMVLQHSAVFVPQNSPMNYIMWFLGKAAAPIFFYFIVEGYHHTHNINKYTRNMAIFAVISYLPYILCFEGVLNWDTFLNLNIIYTLLIGLLVIRARHEIRNSIAKYLAIGMLFILSCFGDWGYFAPLIILSFDVFYGDYKKQAYVYALIALIRPKMQSNLLVSILSPVLSLSNPHIRSLDFTSWDIFLLQDMGTLLPVLLIYLYNGKKGKNNLIIKWGFYIIYPLHLLIITAINLIFTI